MRLRWLALGVVLTLVLGVATYTTQDAEAINAINGEKSGYQPKGTVCDSDGNCVEIEIGANGTTTTTTPETKPAPEEECDKECQEHEEIKERERFEEGQETAGKVAETVKGKVTETVKGSAEQINEEIAEQSNSTRKYVWKYAEDTVTDAINNATATDEELPPCRNTACLMERRHQAEIDAYNEKQKQLELGKVADQIAEAVLGENELKPCEDTACLMERRHQAELDEFYKTSDQGKELAITNNDLPPCDSTACLMERKHQAELDEFYGITKDSATTIFPQQIIVVNLSSGCERVLEQNLTGSVCLTYKDLLQFDNTVESVSGAFYTDDNGYFHRGETEYEHHCNFYLPEMYPVVIAVDGDTNCWVKERGAMLITVNAITTENFQFKISDSYDVERLRDIQKQDTRILNDEQEHENNVERLENLLEQRDDSFEDMEEELKDFDEETRDLYEEVGQNPDMVKIRDEERKKIVDKYSNRSLDRQDRAWEKELREAQAELDLVLAEKRELQDEQREINYKTSGVATNSTVLFGVGRSVDECRVAQIGSDLDMVGDTINYLLDNCIDSSTEYDNRMIIELAQTPINLFSSANYNYTLWFEQAQKDCLGLCTQY